MNVKLDQLFFTSWPNCHVTDGSLQKLASYPGHVPEYEAIQKTNVSNHMLNIETSHEASRQWHFLPVRNLEFLLCLTESSATLHANSLVCTDAREKDSLHTKEAQGIVEWARLSALGL